MKLPWNRQPRTKDPDVVETPDVAGSMTKVHSLGARALVVGFYLVIALTMLTSLSALVMALSKDIPTAVGAIPGQQTQTDNATAAYAEGFVAAWLAASSTDHAALDTYLDSSDVGALPQTGWTYRDLALANTETPDGSKLTAVTVATSIKETKTVNGKPVDSWPRRYFRAVINTDGGLSPVGLPAPVSGPGPASSNVALRYPESVSTSSDVATTVTSFLAAYATGSGGLERYTAPGSTIAPITPAPFTAAAIRSLNADKSPSASPKDDETLRVLVSATFTATKDQGSTSTYVMTLMARAGRWEVSAINPVPDIEKPSKPSPSTTATERPTP